MAIEWTEDLSTNVDEIDGHHKEILERLSSLYLSCKTGNGRAEISGVLMFLEDYVINHLDTEERYMMKFDYPDYAFHKAEHMSLIKMIVDLKKQFEQEGPSLSVVIKTNFEIADWLRRHICKVDKSLGIFLKSRICS